MYKYAAAQYLGYFLAFKAKGQYIKNKAMQTNAIKGQFW